jgi:hypothetical protein
MGTRANGRRRDGLIRWRTATIMEGRGNGTWNNRLSMVRQALARGVAHGRRTASPKDGPRLRKTRQQSPLPYSDEGASHILFAGRGETRPSARWAHWIKAFLVPR